MVLVVIGALVWHLSTTLQQPAIVYTFTEFMDKVDAGQVHAVTIARDEITGTLKEDETKHSVQLPRCSTTRSSPTCASSTWG